MTVWGQESTAVQLQNDGDITSLLRRVRAQYLAKADEFAARAFGENELEMSRVQLYYANCADQIQGLIENAQLDEIDGR